MSLTYKLNRHCKHCGKLINDKSKTGCCVHCYSKYEMLGKNNPFYGKKHSSEMIEHLKEKCKIASTEKWKDQEYRSHVLLNVVGLKRSEKFKLEQSERVKHQMKDPNLRKIRSEIMKKSWESGAIIYTPRMSTNSSKLEKEFFNLLNEYILVKLKHVIKYISPETHRKRHLFPDGFVEDLNLIIEFNGSYWHADIRLYPDDNMIVHHNVTAGECRNRNKYKEELYKSLGYNYLEVWSLDFINDKNKCISDTLLKINNICLK